MTNKNIVILGGGISGFGAAHRLHTNGVRPILYDKNLYLGGNTASFSHPSGFVFDEGCHLSFTKNERLQELLAQNVNGEYEVIKASVNNHWRGHWIKHPAACNLYGLPTDLTVSVLRDFIAVHASDENAVCDNYAQWLDKTYGRTFAETFPKEYTKKYHTTTADNLSTVWLGPRLYRPSLDEVLRGALTPDTPDVHYVSHFRYPRRAGFVSYLKPFFNQADVHLGATLQRINPVTRLLHFRDGAVQQYDGVISSIPLPELIPMIEGVPPDVLAASQQLACSTCVLVNLGIGREDLSPAHWTYFYDENYFLTRLNCPHMLSPNNVPPGCGSIQAEVYFSKKYRPLDRSPESCIDPVILDLKRCGMIRDDDNIMFREARVIPYANIIFDHDRETALDSVRGYLDDIGIAYCGRYGMWGYLWTDQSFLSGEKAAEKVTERLGRTRGLSKSTSEQA